MKVYFTGAGPGNPELLTMRAYKLLCECKICIYAGSLVSPQVISLINSSAEKYDSAEMDLAAIIAICKKAAEDDIDVVRLHTGDPAIFGAIGEQIYALEELGIAWEIIPGVSSFLAAAAAIGTELTMPEVSQTIVLTRTAGRTPMPDKQNIETYAATGATLCVFLSVHGIADIASTLMVYYGNDCPAAVVYHASWPDQTVIRGTLETIAKVTNEHKIGKTAMIVVGRALEKRPHCSRLYDARFTHGYRKGNTE